ncbi:MAG: hypothetical protein R3B92_03395 [Patescibacteria group bacterium]
MPEITIKGDTSLVGDIVVKGSKEALLNIIVQSLYNTTPILLENVQLCSEVSTLIEVLKTLGVQLEQVSKSRIRVSPMGLSQFEIPYAYGAKSKNALLLVGPLLKKFGKAIVPIPLHEDPKYLDKIRDMWQAAGIEVVSDSSHYVLRANFSENCTLHIVNHDSFLSYLALSLTYNFSKTAIANLSNLPEVEMTLEYMRANEIHIDNISQQMIFTSEKFCTLSEFTIPSDIKDSIIYIVATLLTKGNVTLKNVSRDNLFGFTSLLSKMGFRYEFGTSDIRVWRAKSEKEPLNLNYTDKTLINYNALPYIVLLALCTQGDSYIYMENAAVCKELSKELNRMGTKIKLHVSSEDMDYVNITSPTKLKGIKTSVTDLDVAIPLIIAAISAGTETEISVSDELNNDLSEILLGFSKLGAIIDINA